MLVITMWFVMILVAIAFFAYVIKWAVVEVIGLSWYKGHKAQLLNGEAVEVKSIKERIGHKWFENNKFMLKGFAD